MYGESDQVIEEVYRSDWGRILATLIRLFGDFEVAEEAAQEAFAAAVDQWRIRVSRRLPGPGSSRRPGTRPSTGSGAERGSRKLFESIRRPG